MTTRAQSEESSASIDTPASGIGAAFVVNRPVRRSTRCSGIVVVSSGHGQIRAAPGRKLTELSRGGQPHVARDVQLDAGGERDAAPDRALGRGRQLGLIGSSRSLVDGLADLIESPAAFLERLDL